MFFTAYTVALGNLWGLICISFIYYLFHSINSFSKNMQLDCPHKSARSYYSYIVQLKVRQFCLSNLFSVKLIFEVLLWVLIKKWKKKTQYQLWDYLWFDYKFRTLRKCLIAKGTMGVILFIIVLVVVVAMHKPYHSFQDSFLKTRILMWKLSYLFLVCSFDARIPLKWTGRKEQHRNARPLKHLT